MLRKNPEKQPARRRWALVPVTLLAMVMMVLPGLVTNAASAGDGDCIRHYNPDGSYTCTYPGDPGTPGDPGHPGGGTSEPTCVLGGEYTFCVGTNACYYEDWHPPFRLPDGPKPSEDAEPMLRWCLPGGYGVFGPPGLQIVWIGPDEPRPPSLAQQAQTAVGQLDLVLPDLLTSPTNRTVVNLPTWFWLDGADSEQVGTSAFGLRAVATVRDLTVDTGDGSSITCPWVSSSAAAEESCSYTYDRASRDGGARWRGRPAYEVSAHATWTLRFEMNGVNVVIPGAPAVLDGPASTAVLRVDEVQSVVRDAR